MSERRTFYLRSAGRKYTNGSAKIIGSQPKHIPYLKIDMLSGNEDGYIDNPRTLRALAHGILRALGEER